MAPHDMQAYAYVRVDVSHGLRRRIARTLRRHERLLDRLQPLLWPVLMLILVLGVLTTPQGLAKADGDSEATHPEAGRDVSLLGDGEGGSSVGLSPFAAGSAFSSISVDGYASNVSIVAGETYDVVLSSEGTVRDALVGLDGGLLVVSGSSNSTVAGVTITVPRQVRLADIDVRVGSGAIRVSDVRADTLGLSAGEGSIMMVGDSIGCARLGSASGNLIVSGGTFDDLQAGTASSEGSISMNDVTAGAVSASTGGGMSVHGGTLGVAHLDSQWGDIEVTDVVWSEATINATSGSVRLGGVEHLANVTAHLYAQDPITLNGSPLATGGEYAQKGNGGRLEVYARTIQLETEE